MALPKEKNRLVVGDHPLVGNYQASAVDKGGTATVRGPSLVDWKGVVVNSSLGSI